MKIDIHSVRSCFPMLHDKENKLVYLDSAATSLKPYQVIDAISSFYAHSYGTVHRAIYDLSIEATEKYQNVREKVRDFLKASHAEEIIFTKGTTESINLVARSFGKAFIHPGDTILISEMEHHSNIVPWQMLVEEKKAYLKVVRIDSNGNLDLEHYEQLLKEGAKLVAITHVSNALGTINPIQTITKLAHRFGAKVLVDGAQAVAHFPVSVKELDADFYVFSGHKMYGPTGIGVLYGKKGLLEEMPPYQGGGDMIEKVTFKKTTYAPIPLKFEAGTPPIAQVIGLGAAIDFLTDIGMDKVDAHEKELKVFVRDSFLKASFIERVRVLGNLKSESGILSFNIEGIHHLDLGSLLNFKGIAVRTGHHCAQPVMDKYGVLGSTRASFGVYNTKEEVQFFVNALEQVIKDIENL